MGDHCSGRGITADVHDAEMAGGPRRRARSCGRDGRHRSESVVIVVPVPPVFVSVEVVIAVEADVDGVQNDREDAAHPETACRGQDTTHRGYQRV